MQTDMPMQDKASFRFEVKLWTETEFAAGRQHWTSLLTCSTSDHLFMSWDWFYNWWLIWKPEGAELSIVTCWDSSKLVGIAPLYVVRDSYFKGFIKFERLQMLGSNFSGRSGIRCEYDSIIIREGYGQEIIDLIINKLKSMRNWSELVTSDYTMENPLNEAFFSSLKKICRYSREDKKGPTFWIDTIGDYKSYIEGLGKNTRLKLYNRRKLLRSMGEVRLAPINPGNFQYAIDTMNKWHIARWGNPAFPNTYVQFLHDLTNAGDGAADLSHSSILMLDDEPLSVMINLTQNHCIYNIQLGFAENFDKRIALGTLHLGFAIEQAFDDPSIRRIDFLEGTGKHSNYKSRIAGEGEMLQSVRWFRSIRLQLLFLFYDQFLRR